MKVSIIMAAYNRSNVLRYAVQSILRSTFSDWELLVIGDACTDDTEEVVASFHDPRISFYNMPENCGEQTGPNNEGLRRAQGEYVAYLNQDDMWLPEHLQTLVDTIEQHHADGAFGAGAVFLKENEIQLNGVIRGDVYSPWEGAAVVGSLWLIKRAVLLEIGGWRFSKDIVIPPSQDVLLRLWKKGKRLVSTSRITAVLIHAGYYPKAYSDRLESLHKEIFDRMHRSNDFRHELYHSIALTYERKRLAESLAVRYAVKKLLLVFAKTIGRLFHTTPTEVNFFIRYRKKGEFLQQLRKSEGLTPLKK